MLPFGTVSWSIKKEKLFQVSSDGPNVNLLFLKVLIEKHKDEKRS